MLRFICLRKRYRGGIPMSRVAGSRTGVYVGCMTSDYEDMSTHDIYDLAHNTAAGVSEAMTANRVSWFFDLRGPSLTIDTACSSSFPDGMSHSFDSRANGYGRGEGIGAIVVKRLSDAVRDGDVIRAVIRGSAVNTDGKTPSVTMPSSEAQAELIRTAYKRAGIPLKDTRYVELHGTGTPVGDPIELSAIAATFGASATPEDPIFVGSIKPAVGHTEGCAGLAGVLRAIASLERGTILPTVGIETVNPKLKFKDWNLALPPGSIPWPSQGPRRASVNSFGFGGANAHVILEDAYHYLKDRSIAGVHDTDIPASEQSPEEQTEPTVRPEEVDSCLVSGVEKTKKVFVFSSRDQPGLQRIAKSLQSHLTSVTQNARGKEAKPAYLDNIAYTLAARRSVFDYRSFVVSDSLENLSSQLSKSVPSFRRPSKLNGVVFVFTGQGAQWAGMGRELLSYPVFSDSIARSSACLSSLGCSFDLLTEIQRTHGSSIDSPEYSQPICTAVQVAIVDLLKDWSISPRAVIGHSSGEIAAAFAAGIITHQDAIKVAYYRGIYSLRVAKGPRRGAMLAAGISADEASQFLEALPKGSVAVAACINSPKSVTLSGDEDAVSLLEERISSEQKFARKLRVSTAYHSPHMRDVADECLAAMDGSGFSQPRKTEVLMFSSVTGDLVDHCEVNTSYWVRNMCQPVLFSGAMQNLLTYSPNRRSSRKVPYKWNSVVEIGPHSALKAPVVQIMEGLDKKLSTELPYLSVLVRKEDAVSTALKAAATFWALGESVSLSRVNREDERKAKPQVLSDLPPYQWNHDKQYWHETSGTRSERLKTQPRTDLLGVPIEDQNQFEPQWKNYLRISENPWIEDHAITGTNLYPGAGMLIMVLEAAQQLAEKGVHSRGIEFRDVHFDRGLVIPGEGAVETRLSIRLPDEQDESLYSFAVFSNTGSSSWIKHCFGNFVIQYDHTPDELGPRGWARFREEYDKLRSLPSRDIEVEKLYKDLHDIGMEYGDMFQNVTALATTDDGTGCYGTVEIPDTKSAMPSEFEFPHLIHPATLDAIFHLMVVAVSDGGSWKEAAVPYRLERMFIANDLPQGAGALFSGYSYRRNQNKNGQLSADLVVSDESWEHPKIIVDGLHMRQVTGAVPSSQGPSNDLGGVERRCTALSWKLDPASFLSASSTSAPSLSRLKSVSGLLDWLDIESHRTPELSILVDGDTVDPSAVDQLRPFISGESAYRGASKLTVIGVTEEVLDIWREIIEAGPALAEVNFQLHETHHESHDDVGKAKFDLVLTGPSDDGQSLESTASSWAHQLQPRGRVLVFSKNGAIPPAQAHPQVSGTSDHSFAIRGVALDQGSLAVAAPFTEPSPEHQTIRLLVPESYVDAQAQALVQDLEKGLLELSQKVRKSHATNMTDDFGGEHVISLLDLGSKGGFVTNWTSSEFDEFRQLIGSARHIFWLTRGGQMLVPELSGLETAATTGFLRVLRNENPQLTITHLDLSPAADATKVDTVLRLWASSVEGDVEDRELEFAELDGEIYIPRTVQEASFDEEIALATSTAPPVNTALGATGGPLQLDTDGFIWHPIDFPQSGLEPEQVEVRVTSISTVPSSSGVDSLAKDLWAETTGVVTACGSSVVGLRENDHVVLLGNTNSSTYLRKHQNDVIKVPETVPLLGAASTIWLYLMASYILDRVVCLQDGDSVLICDALAPLGEALVSLAHNKGAKVLATVANGEEKRTALERLALPEDSVLDTGKVSIASLIRHRTEGNGVDVLVAPSSQRNAYRDVSDFVSDFGRVAVTLNGDEDHAPPRKLGHRNISYATVNPRQILGSRRKIVAQLLRKVPEIFALGSSVIHPSLNVFPVSQLGEAIESGKASGEKGIVAVGFEDDTLVPVRPRSRSNVQLPADGTYVLAGGLGSLGLRIAKLMVEHGAKHIVLLSRSGQNPKWDSEISAITLLGGLVEVLKCDVTNKKEVEEAVSSLVKAGRTVRGVVQCAMVLQDSIFSNMTHTQWRTAFAPKVAGTWHLHNSLLAADLDFFVMLSSVVSIIGNVSQANYAAANSFMDAFAHYRRTALGLPAVSLNVGLVRDSDHEIDGTGMEHYLERFGHMASVSTTLEELDIGLLECMRAGKAAPPQVVFGMSDALRREDQWTRDRKFGHRMARTVTSEGESSENDAEAEVKDALAHAASVSEAATVVAGALKRLLAPGLGVQPGDIGDDKPLYEVGVDSFKAVEIRNQVFRDLKSDISVFEILSSRPLAELAGIIAMGSQLVPAEAKAGGLQGET
ncbi:hypothetical protein INS49_001010 [Diaporthe citri]|uniref:uncharacterized protein n=1 Tax=Diaporthe citri TaxID=83186 RepID=UPI001C7E9084|nr:uncharacterized protein INS49_001010 [Diaporthe citri]KAG6366829.1 hypothetical protein INS49_001010 [Diaporthe citri]